jgi:hypothetical protein
LATVTLVCWSQRCFALLAAQPDLAAFVVVIMNNIKEH